MNFSIVEKGFIKGLVRTIECDSKRYPTYESVDQAIRNGDAKISPWKENIIPTVGKVAIIRRLVNAATLSNEGMITYGAVGTGTATPLITDTQLATETFRKLLATKIYSSTQATLRMFMTTTEGNGTLREYGLFGEAASGTANSGTLFERILITRTKTASNTLTIETKISIS